MNGIASPLREEIGDEQIRAGLLLFLVVIDPQEKITRSQDVANVLANFNIGAGPMVELLGKRGQWFSRRENFRPIPRLQEKRGSQQKGKREGETRMSFHGRDSTFVHNS